MRDLKILCAATLTALSATLVFGVDSANVILKNSDGKISRRSVKLEKTDDNAMRLRIAKSEVPKGALWLEIYPDTATATKGDPGYFIFSRGEYINFTRENLSMVRPKNLMPIFGAKTPHETFVGIVKTLHNEYALCASAKDGKHKMYLKYGLRSIAGGLYDDIVVDFYTLTGDDADYCGMGRKYRQLRLKSGEIKPIRERIKTNKLLEKTWGNVVARLSVCATMPTPKKDNVYFKNPPPIRVIASFERQKETIDALSRAGIKDVTLVLPGWQRGGVNGCCPDIFPIPEELGGEAGLKSLIAYAKAKGYPLAPNADHTCAYHCAKMWDEDYIIKRSNGSLLKMGIFGGGRMHYICLKRSWPLFIKEQIKRTKDLGFEGPYYIDVFSARPPDPCFDPNHMANRKEIAAVQDEIISYAQELFGSVLSEAGFDHCLQKVDFINYTSGIDYFQYELPKERGLPPRFDGIYPLWEIVYHGIVLATPGRTTQNNVIECFFTKDINKNDGAYDPWAPQPKDWLESPKLRNRMLRLVEWGGRPIIYDLTTSTVAELGKMYEFYQPYKHLQLEFMDAHREISKGVFLTEYSDGSQTIVNYTDKDFEYKGVKVPPQSYRLFGPGKPQAKVSSTQNRQS